MRIRAWVALVLFACAGCGAPKPAHPTVSVSSGDERMNAAMQTARSTVGTFTAAVQAPKSNQSAFAVKMPVTDGKNTEHMWLAGVSYDGKMFHGTINNKPETVGTVKLGQAVQVDPAKISDWMYIEDGSLVGGYTLRVVRALMSPAERADFDKGLPFTIK